MIFSKLENLKQIVNNRAKFQKVLVVYDDTVPTSNICNLYEQIKEICVFNKTDLQNLNLLEINNGYKLLIFYCSADNFLKLNLNLGDFINIFVPTNKHILPFFVKENFLNTQENYLILQDAKPDVTILFSCLFNKFYSYFKGLLFNENVNAKFDVEIKNLNQQKLIEMLSSFNLEFEDLKILKKCNLDLEFLPIVDYLLLFAFLFLFEAVHIKNLSLVDCYKSIKEDYKSIDKFYAISTNNTFLEIIYLNYYELTMNLCSVLKVLNSYIPFAEQLKNVNKDIIFKLKDYAKKEDSLLNLLYIFNFFD